MPTDVLANPPSGAAPRRAERRDRRISQGFRRSLLGLTAVLLLFSTGCSIRKLAYNLAARLATSRIADTFHLDSRQKSDLETRVHAVHDWHRRSELPQYATVLDGAIRRCEDGMSREDLTWMFDELDGAWKRMAGRLAVEAGQVLTQLRPDQIDKSEAEMKKSERERFEKLELPEEQYIQARLKVAKKNLKTWLGSYNDAQLAEYERFVRKNRPEELRRRLKTQANEQLLLDALRRRASAKEIETIVLRWVTRQEVQETPGFQQAETRNQEDFIQFLLAMDRTLTPEQRRHLLRELRAVRTDLAELAAER